MELGTAARRLACGLAIAGLTAPAPAQVWLGLIAGQMAANEAAREKEIACRRGVPMSDKEVAEAHTPAATTMKAYWSDAQAGRSFAGDFNIDKHAQWSVGGTVAKAAQVGGQADPFVKAGLALDPGELGFVRAGDGASALGQWVVRDAAGARRGTYTAAFTRKLGEWRLSTLALTGAREYAEPVVQYCHTPQDVLGYRIEDTTADVARLERAVPKAERQVAKQEQALAKARGTAARRSASDIDRAAVGQEAERLNHLRTGLEAMRTQLADARKQQAEAIADAKAKEEAKAAALRELAANG